MHDSGDHQHEQQYWQRMAPLGPLRCQVLSCTSFGYPRAVSAFDPPPAADLRAAFDRHMTALWQRWLPQADGPQFNGLAVVAAGLLLGGRLAMVNYILDQLPATVVRHGYCNTIARQIVVAMLPLPEALRDWAQWTAGSAAAQALHDWLAAHQALLQWQPAADKFVLTDLPGPIEGKI